jgi:protein-S-isoprenylcysteine O-methyltransferase Ste14
MGFLRFALGWVIVCWILFTARFLQTHIRVRRERGSETHPEREHDLRAPLSMLGLLLEGLAFFVILVWRKPLSAAPVWAAPVSIAVSALSLWLASEAVRHLGRQWRIKAVVTRDHELVTSGPYALVRHPIYLALLGMAFSTAVLITSWQGIALALVIYVAGTEIRVRAEDGILRQHFGGAFEDYKARVAAYLPYLR